MEPTTSTPHPMHDFPERTITLADGRPGLRTALHISASPVGTTSTSSPSDSQPSTLNSQPVLDFIASSDTLDRYHEIIDAAGWRLDNYRRNPVFQNAHNYGDIIFTIGKALITEIRQGPLPGAASGPLSTLNSQPSSPSSTRSLSTLNSQPSAYLFQRIQFATDVNPMARIAYGLYSGGYLSAVSVGFIPLRWENGDGTQHTLREAPGGLSTLSSQPSTQQFRRKYLEQELLEVSAVGIPANPDALALGLKSGALHKSDLQDLLGLLHSVVGHSDPFKVQRSTFEVQGSASVGSQPSTFNSQLISLARALRDLLRRS